MSLTPRSIDEEFQARDGLIALLPYASSDEWLSMLVAIATPDAVDRTALLDGLPRPGSARQGVTASASSQAIVARAALGDDVLERLRALPRRRAADHA